MEEANFFQVKIPFARALEELLKEDRPVRFQAKGFSMFPALIEGDYLTISPFDSAEVRIGMIVAVKNDGGNEIFVHRVVGRKGGLFLLKGDNTAGYDGLIQGNRIIGRLSKLERGRKEREFSAGEKQLLITFLNRSCLIYHSIRLLLIIMPLSLRRLLKRKVFGISPKPTH